MKCLKDDIYILGGIFMAKEKALLNIIMGLLDEYSSFKPNIILAIKKIVYLHISNKKITLI